MPILHSLHAELKAEFTRSENGKERSIWFLYTLLAIILPFTSSTTSNLLWGLPCPLRFCRDRQETPLGEAVVKGLENDPPTGNQWHCTPITEGRKSMKYAICLATIFTVFFTMSWAFAQDIVVVLPIQGKFYILPTRGVVTPPLPPPTVPTVMSAGQVWMDRNLGASRVAISSTDEQAYGDLYQWGRGRDGHEKRGSSNTGIQAVSDTPGHGNFIVINFDWRTPSNDNLWQGVFGINNPCPAGFRLPTNTEWELELASWSSNNAVGAYSSPLKLVVAGYRTHHMGYLVDPESGYYSSSTPGGVASLNLIFNSSDAMTYGAPRAGGQSVRCIKD